jgi:hypothetical protein
MGYTVRHYLFTDDGQKRIPQRVVDGLIHGRDAVPEYAGMKLRVASVSIETTNGRPQRIIDAIGAYFSFDEHGQIHRALQETVFGLFDGLGRQQEPNLKVVSLTRALDRKRWLENNRWTVGKDELDAVASDIWPKKGSPSFGVVKGTKAKPPPLTYDARSTLQEAQSKLSLLSFSLEQLSEPALKGLAFKAREIAEETHDPLLRGLGDAADQRREILARHRTGRGSWFAVVEVVTWSRGRRDGRTSILASEKCPSVKKAEEAAQRLLAANAKHMREYTTVEASIYSELEWSEDDV